MFFSKIVIIHAKNHAKQQYFYSIHMDLLIIIYHLLYEEKCSLYKFFT